MPLPAAFCVDKGADLAGGPCAHQAGLRQRAKYLLCGGPKGPGASGQGGPLVGPGALAAAVPAKECKRECVLFFGGRWGACPPPEGGARCRLFKGDTAQGASSPQSPRGTTRPSALPRWGPGRGAAAPKASRAAAGPQARAAAARAFAAVGHT